MTLGPDPVKSTVDAISLMTVVGTLMQWLPAIAALASLVWSCIRIYETATVQQWIKNCFGPKAGLQQTPLSEEKHNETQS
jgi:hypothetical protein